MTRVRLSRLGAARQDAGRVSPHGGLIPDRSTLYPRVTVTIGSSATVSAWNRDGAPCALAVFDNSANRSKARGRRSCPDARVRNGKSPANLTLAYCDTLADCDSRYIRFLEVLVNS